MEKEKVSRSIFSATFSNSLVRSRKRKIEKKEKMKRPRDRGSNVRSGMMRMQRVEFFFFCGGGCYLVLVDTLLLDAVQVGFFFFFPLVRQKHFFFSVVAFEGGRRDTHAGQ
jgi:hypothetical protein